MINYSLDQLVDLKQVRELLESHHRLSGMAYGLFDAQENNLIAVGWQDICIKFHRVHPVTCARCRESDAFIKAHLQDADGGLLEYHCKNNMIDIAMPIVIEGRHVGTFFTGQFFYDDAPPDREFFVAQARALGFDEKAYLAALEKVPSFNREHIQSNVLFLHKMVQNLAQMGLKNLRIASEVEERKRVEQNLQFFSFALNSVREAAFLIDEKARFHFVNEEACHVLGYPRAELLGLGVSDIDPDFPMARWPEHWNELRARQALNFEGRHRAKDGRIFPVEVNANYLEYDGKAYNLALVRDITERKLAEEKISLLAAIVESTDDAVIGKTLDEKILSWNKGAEQIYGHTAEEIIGRSISVLVPADRQAELEAILVKLKAGEKIQHFETVRLRKDGQPINVALTISPIKDASGGFVGASIIARDITERKRMIDLLHQRAQEFQALVENSPDIIARYDRECRRIYVNPAYLKMTGIPKAKLLGVPPATLSLLSPDAAASLQEVIRRVIETGRPAEIDLPVQLPAREQLWFAVNVIPEFDRAGQVASVMSISRDVTARKRAEAALRRLNRELRAISDCNQTLMRATDEPALLKDICHIVCDKADYRMAWVGYAENDEAKTVRPVAWAGVEEGYLTTAHIVWSDTERGRGPTGTAIRTGKTTYTQDFATNHQISPWRQEATRRGYRCSISLPLKNEAGVVFGAFTIYASEPNAFTPDEIRLLEELAGDLTFGITVLRGRVERKRDDAINASRLHIMQFAATHSLDELLEETLNEAEKLTDSVIGFYHFVEADQQTLVLQNWSTRTKAEFCRAKGKGEHYPISKAGVWVECVHQRKPVIHNDYASLPNRRGLPEGHAEVIRELVVPVLRGENIKAILGVGNKPTGYVDQDVEVLSLLADLAWEIAERKRVEDQIRKLNAELEQRVAERTSALEREMDTRFRQQQFLEAVLENIEAGIVACDADGILTFFNRKTRELHSLPPTPIPAEQWAEHYDLFLPDGKTPMRKEDVPLFRALQGERVANDEMVILPRGGEPKFLLASGQTIRDKDGRKIGAVVAMHDITERRQMEDTLRASEERMRLFFEHQLVGTAITSPEKGWVQVNDKLCQILGYSRAELMRLTWAEMTYPDDLAADVTQFERLLKGEIEGYMLEKRFVRKDGGIVFTNLAVGCVRRPDRSVDYVLALLEDITDRKRAEENIQKLNAELQQRALQFEKANQELQRMNKLFIGRELRMVELKEKLKALEKQAGSSERNQAGRL